ARPPARQSSVPEPRPGKRGTRLANAAAPSPAVESAIGDACSPTPVHRSSRATASFTLRSKIAWKSVLQLRYEKYLIDPLSPEFALDLGHQAGVVGGAQAWFRWGDFNVQPVVVEFLARDPQIYPGGLGGLQLVPHFLNDVRYLRRSGHDGTFAIS